MLLVVALFATTMMAKSQEMSSSDLKPTSGYTVEVNFLPANTSSPVSMQALKGRMFLSENMAVRVGLNIGMNKTYDENIAGGTSTNPNEEVTNSYFIFGLTPGIEMHMEGTKRLSPYFGAELGFFTKSSKGEIVNNGNTSGNKLETTGCWTDGSNKAYSQFGLNVILGTDFYVSKNLYIGAEVGFGFANTSFKEIEVSTTTGSITNTITTPKSKDFSLGFNYNPCIRLGWAF